MLKHWPSSKIVTGIDEAGRGCLAGPVVAAAVILPKGLIIEGLNDSKQLSAKKRMLLREQIFSEALAWGIGQASPEEIDALNILQATYLSMHRAIESLSISPEFILVDGNRFKPFGELPFACEIKGDGRFFSIAAASILAKTERDLEMEKLHSIYPEFNWKQNKGYPTAHHRSLVLEKGRTEFHRKSFKIKAMQLDIPGI